MVGAGMYYLLPLLSYISLFFFLFVWILRGDFSQHYDTEEDFPDPQPEPTAEERERRARAKAESDIVGGIMLYNLFN